MDNEIYPSDSDQSDEDYCPAEAADDAQSEDDSSDNDNNEEGNKEETTPKKNSKKSNKKKLKNGRNKTKDPPTECENEIGNGSAENEEDEKKRADDLWADFLKDTDTEVKKNATPSHSKVQIESSVKNPTKASGMPASPKKKIKITEIMEFAGEEVKVTREVDAVNSKSLTVSHNNGSTSKKPNCMPGRSPAIMPVKRPGGGLNSILGQIGKKNKISVLEKTKLDWDGFKSSEGLSEELTTHNKGRDGYLERQDFLERTDHRQFEIEKGMRQNKRSNR